MPCSIKRPQHLQQAVTKPTSDLRNSRVGPGVLGNRRTGVRNAPENRWKPAGCLLGTCRAFAGNAVGFCWERARFPLDLSRASAGVLLDACMIGAVSLPDMRHLFARSACYDGKHGATAVSYTHLAWAPCTRRWTSPRRGRPLRLVTPCMCWEKRAKAPEAAKRAPTSSTR